MNSEELKKEFGLLMPSEINGFKRPDESIPNSNDFFLEIPQLISKDPVLYSTMNLIFSVILSNDKLLKQWIDTLQNVVNAQDWRVVTDSLKGYMTPELKKKLDGIANGANNYVHPSSHPASMIAQDATHRFVSDTEKNTWNAKASTAVVSTTANGLMPKRNGNASYIFTGDGVWKSLAWDLITGKPSTFAPSAHNHDSSYLKRNQTTQNDMNACTVEGIYRFSGTLSNAWTGTSWGTLLVFNNQYNGGSGVGGTFLVQIALPTDGRMWTRQRVNTGAWTSWVRVAITTDNVASATKATQDSQGQQINTTYIKGVTGSNATLTITKGNGTTSTVTINNVTHATNADTATKAGNINQGYAQYSSKFPLNTFRSDILGRSGNGFALRPFYCLLPNGTYGSSPGVGFGSTDTQGFLQVSYNAPIAFIGGGNNNEIGWHKQLAFVDSPAFTGTPTAPTPSTSDNSTKVATTAFVKSLFTANKATNGWWKEASTGIIYQWGINNMSATSKSFNFNISFPNMCFIVRAGDTGIDSRSVGATPNNNTTFTVYTQSSQPLIFSWFAIGY